MAKLDEPMMHDCGQSFTYTQSYAKHAKECDGTKPATSGRIAARAGERTPPAAKRPTVRRKKSEQKTIRVRVPRSVVVSVRDKFVAELRADRAKLAAVIEKLDDTIRAVEALA